MILFSFYDPTLTPSLSRRERGPLFMLSSFILFLRQVPVTAKQ
jgi:hypothetical protein